MKSKGLLEPMLVALVVTAAASAAWADDALPPCWRGADGSSFQAWSFDQPANPASPETVTNLFGPLANVTVGTGGAGWIDTLYLFGARQGIWDLGVSGTVSFDIPGDAAPSNAWKYVSVQVTQYRDGIYNADASVDVPGALLVAVDRIAVGGGSFGGAEWIVHRTLWQLEPAPDGATVILGAASNGAAIDGVIIDTLLTQGDNGDAFPPCWRGVGTSTYQNWSFHTDQVEPPPEQASHPGETRARILPGPLSFGWQDQDEVYGCRQGYWDLGEQGQMLLSMPMQSGPPGAYGYVRVQTVQYQDSLIFTERAAVEVTGATPLGTPSQLVLETTPFGGSWIVDSTVWRTASCLASQEVVITAPPGGALVDQVIVDTLCQVFSCPPDQVVAADPGMCEATGVTWSLPAPDGCLLRAATSSPSPGSSFPLGTNAVVCEYLDAEEQPFSCTFSVTVEDTEPPQINCPSDLVAYREAGVCGAYVDYLPTVLDSCPGAGAICTPPSGALFPLGLTLVSCTATDAAGNVSAPCTFTVEVTDTAGDLYAPCWRGTPTSTYQHWAFSTSQNPGLPELDSGAGSPEAEILAGPLSLGWQNEDPVFGCRQGFWDLGQLGAIECRAPAVTGDGGYQYARVQVVQYLDDAVFPNPVSIQVQGAIAAGSGATQDIEFTSLGRWTVEQSLWRIDSPSNEVAVILQAGPEGALIDQVIVDTVFMEDPSCPPHLVLAADPGSCSRQDVTWAQPQVDGCLILAVSEDPPSGSAFPVGTSPVTQTITDGEGRITTCAFAVTVLDQEPPEILACAPSDTARANHECQSLMPDLSTLVTATDSCGVVSIQQQPPPGTLLAEGVHPVEFLVLDASGNGVSCASQFEVLPSTNVMIAIALVVPEEVELSWPAPCDNLSPKWLAEVSGESPWLPVPSAEAVDGDRRFVIVPATNHTSFFRLSR